MLDVSKIIYANSMQFFFLLLILEISVTVFGGKKKLKTSLIMESVNLTEFKLYR